jgi:hypothetical protein
VEEESFLSGKGSPSSVEEIGWPLLSVAEEEKGRERRRREKTQRARRRRNLMGEMRLDMAAGMEVDELLETRSGLPLRGGVFEVDDVPKWKGRLLALPFLFMSGPLWFSVAQYLVLLVGGGGGVVVVSGRVLFSFVVDEKRRGKESDVCMYVNVKCVSVVEG